MVYALYKILENVTIHGYRIQTAGCFGIEMEGEETKRNAKGT